MLSMDLIAAPPPVFEAVITPHRSLSPRGLRTLLAVIVLTCSLSAFLWVRLGAWPVAGFTGVELPLAAWLLRRNARAARASEHLVLSERGLRVVRTDQWGARQELTLSPAWLRVELQNRPGRVPALLLRTRDQNEEVAACLGEAEKRDLAQVLDRVLQEWRHPCVDNPQLRENRAS
jgi:uncharacterized membrane protein